MTTRAIPYLPLTRKMEEMQATFSGLFDDALGRADLIGGDVLRKFEDSFARYSGFASSAGVGNGTDALVLMLRALGIGSGDEVVVPAYTFASTLFAVHLSGGTPVVVDIRNDGTMDASQLKSVLTRKTKAVLAVTLYGNAIDYEQIADFCAEHGLIFLVDGAQSHGLERDVDIHDAAKPFALATSFYPTKNLGALGDGGAVLSDDQTFTERIKRLRQYGSSDMVEFHEVSGNSRLDSLQAAFLQAQLDYLDFWNSRRRLIARKYEISLASTDQYLRQPVSRIENSVSHHFVFLSSERDNDLERLRTRGVEARVVYPYAAYALPALKGVVRLEAKGYPVAERFSREVLAVPCHPWMTESEVRAVTGVLASL